MDAMGYLLQSLGIEPAKLMADFEATKKLVEETLTDINSKLTRMEKLHLETVNLLRETNPVLLRDHEQLIKKVDELWQMNKTALSMSSQVRLLPQQSQPTQPTQPSENLLQPPTAQQQPSQ